MDVDDVTLGEVARRVDRLESEMGRRLEGISRKIDSLSFVPSGVYASDQSAVQQRLGKLENAASTADSRAWQTRLALVVAILGLPISIATAVIAAILLKSMHLGG